MVSLSGLPDAIPEAFGGWLADTFEAIANEFSTALTDELVKGLLKVPNPYGTSYATNAWNGMFEISLILLPICIALALIAWPFSEDRETGLMDLVVRTVMVLFFVGISQPAWGFAIDATNAVTVTILNLDPSARGITYGFGGDSFGTTATAGTWAVKFIVSIVAGGLAVIAVILSIFFLILRWFMVWMVYIGTPFYAVVWFVGRGPLTAVGNVGATFMRMGVFSLLAGPIIALLVLTFQVFEGGGLLQTAGNGIGGNVGLLAAELALMLLFPVLLIITVWKMVSWAGQPIGVGEAASVATMAVTAAVGGAAVGTLGGSAGASSSGAASGSAGGATNGSTGSAAAPKSSPATGSVGSTNAGMGESGLASRISGVKNWGRQQAAKTPGIGGLDQKVSTARAELATARHEARQATAKSAFIEDASLSESLDLEEANEYGILPEPPVAGAEAQVYRGDDGATKASYESTNGPQTVNLTRQGQTAGREKAKADEQVVKGGRTVNSLERRKKAVRAGNAGATVGLKAGRAATKVGAAAMVGGVGGNSYLAHSLGRRAGQPLIGPNDTNQGKHSNYTVNQFGKAEHGQAEKNGELVENSEGDGGQM